MTEKTIRRVLIANRGEIAIRIARSLRELGIEPILVHSAVDADAAHALAFANVVDLGGDSAATSYLDKDKILEAARRQGADAIHPGYGFLSENAAFAAAVEQAGFIFLGPPSAAMEAMASKQRAKELAIAAGVPVIPGYSGDTGDDARMLDEARRIGFPVLIKASGGGGGKGMRLVDHEADFAEELAACRREARSAFGDATMLLEKRIHPARHVEIQVFGDRLGNVVSLNERDCSVQRRHQKVIEEAPAPGMTTELRAAMADASMRLAREVGYVSAGTVEFLLAPDGQFYFLEMNTRLQVEHPVTELTTGLDLVQLQLRVAAGESLPAILGDRDLSPRGHAIEVRVYAESPEHGYLPAAGRLGRVIEPKGPFVRVDSGVYQGCDVGVHFDPMLSKIIVHAADRQTACRRMVQALADTTYLGIDTNVDFLRRVIASEPFYTAQLRTDLLDMNPQLAEPMDPAVVTADEVYVAAALGELLGSKTSVQNVSGATAEPTPWQTLGAMRVWEEA